MIPLQNEFLVIFFFTALWFISIAFENLLGVSPLIGQLLIGMVLGPSLLNLVPYEQAFKLFGKLGIMLLVVESGLNIDVEKLRAVGMRAIFAAATGVIFPVVLTMTLFAFWGKSWQMGLAAGAALAPTSLGFSAKLLTEVNLLNSPMGQLICAAAVADDVLALCLLAEIKVLQAGSSNDINNDPTRILWWEVTKPILGSFGSILIGFLLVLLLHKPLKNHFSLRRKTGPVKPAILLFCLLITTLLFAFLCALVGSSDLLGCFFAGLVFSSLKEIKVVWEEHLTKSNYVEWGSRLFFGVTIAFSIPSLIDSGGLFDVDVILKGILLSIPAVIGKSFVGLYAMPLNTITFCVLSFAMNGRGEFSFLIASEASSDGILDTPSTSSIIWSLFICSFITPFGFKYFLKKQQQLGEDNSESKTRDQLSHLETDSRDMLEDEITSDGTEMSTIAAGVVNHP